MSEETDYILERGWHGLLTGESCFEEDPVLSRADRWKQRSFQRKKRISSGYEISDRYHVKAEEVKSLAKELVEIKESLKKLEQQELKIKQQLLDLLPELGWLEISGENQDYIVEKLKVHRKPKLDTDKTLKLIRKIHGNDAARVIFEECSTVLTVKSTIYVRPFLKSMNANTDMQSNAGEELSDSLDYKPYHISKDNF